ncbi:hypothetical protein DB346_05165 [Verrucomicrobia bacterium LW23]|nr:hypothetical protein DB346_05165 [Verrucomicrobia bacterium LW23]
MASKFPSSLVPVGLGLLVLAALGYFSMSLLKPAPAPVPVVTTPTPAELEAESKERLRQLSGKLARADILEADRQLRLGRHDQAMACLARAIRTSGSRPAEIRLMSLLQYRNWAMPVAAADVKSPRWKPANISPSTEAFSSEEDSSAAMGRLTPVDTSATALERLASLTPEGARRLRALNGGLLLQLLDATTNMPWMDIPQDAPMRSAAITTDGRWLAASSADVKSWKGPLAPEVPVHYWDTMRGSAVIEPVAEVSGDAGDDSGSTLISPFEKALSLQPGYAVEMRTLSPDSRRVILQGRDVKPLDATGSGDATAGAGRVILEVWNLATLKREGPRITAQGTTIQAASWMADGSRLVTSTSGDTSPTTSYVEVWNLVSEKPVVAMTVEGRVTSTALHPSGKILATSTVPESGSGGLVEFRDIPSLTQHPLSLAFAAMVTAYSKDGQYLLAVDAGGRGTLFDAETLVPLTDPLGDELRPGEGRRSAWHVEEKATSIRCTTPAGKTFTWYLAPDSAAPEWLPRLAEALGGSQLADGGQVAPIADPLGSLEVMRKELNAADVAVDDWLPVGRWILADRAERHIAPYSDVKVPDLEARLVKDGTGSAAHLALLLNPANAKARELFAKHGADMLSSRDSTGITLADRANSPRGNAGVRPRQGAGKGNTGSTKVAKQEKDKQPEKPSESKVSNEKSTATVTSVKTPNPKSVKERSVDASTSTATTLPPKSGATPADEVRSFIMGYFRAGNTGSAANQAAMFAERVEYFDYKASRETIEGYVADYQSKWPDRQFEVLGAPEVTKAKAGIYRVVVKFRYTIRNSEEGIQGLSRNTFVVRQEGAGKPGAFEIVSLKSDIIQRASMPMNRKDLQRGSQVRRTDGSARQEAAAPLPPAPLRTNI